MFTIGIDFPRKRISSVEHEMRDRNNMHLLSFVKPKFEKTHDAAFVARILNFSDFTPVWKNLLRAI